MARYAADMLATVRRGDTLLATAAYDSNALRETLAQRGARGQIKPMAGRVIALSFNRRIYKKRNAVERFFNKLKHFRAVARDPTNAPRVAPPCFRSFFSRLESEEGDAA